MNFDESLCHLDELVQLIGLENVQIQKDIHIVCVQLDTSSVLINSAIKDMFYIYFNDNRSIKVKPKADSVDDICTWNTLFIQNCLTHFFRYFYSENKKSKLSDRPIVYEFDITECIGTNKEQPDKSSNTGDFKGIKSVDQLDASRCDVVRLSYRVKRKSLKELMECFQYGPLWSFVALQQSQGDLNKASEYLIDLFSNDKLPDKFDMYTKAETKVRDLVNMGFDLPLACAAAIKSEGVAETALTLCCQNTPDIWEYSTKISDTTTGCRVVLSDNPFIACIDWLQERLSHFGNYCIVCHKPHNCCRKEAVVCSDALCVFQWERLQHRGINCNLCCFDDCHKKSPYEVSCSWIGMPLEVLVKQSNLPMESIMDILTNRFLPKEEIKKLIDIIANKQGKQNVPSIKKITVCYNPELAARFEHYRDQLKMERSEEYAVSKIAYHGTRDTNIASIQEKGFLLSKLSANTGNRGYYGAGIYCSPDVHTAYCYGRNTVFVLATLQGKQCAVPQKVGQPLKEGYDSHRSTSGKEIALFKEDAILPCYILHF